MAFARDVANCSPRSVVAALLVAVILSGSMGVPLVPVVVKSGEAFPCQGCNCSCRDAATCWNGCCCMTDAEKLAWAKQHGVTPPRFVVERSRQQQALACRPEQAGSCGSCGATSSSEAPDEPSTAKENSTQFVSIAAIRRCQGLGGIQLILTCAIPGLYPRPWQPTPRVVALIPAANPTAEPVTHPPAEPPPRIGVCV